MLWPLSTVVGLDNDDVKTIGAAATCFGVLLALFAPTWKMWWRAPLLSIQYDGTHDEPHWDHVLVSDRAFFLRIRIRNARGCDAARDVEAIVTSFRSDALGLNGRSLEWSGQRRRFGTPVTKIDIPPGLSRHVDVVQVSPVSPTHESGAVGHPHRGHAAPSLAPPIHPYEARLCVYPKPWGAGHMVRAGRRELEVVVTATNANAVTYAMTLEYLGDLSAKLVVPPQPGDRSVRQRVRSFVKRR
jgi:hypothetical protein